MRDISGQYKQIRHSRIRGIFIFLAAVSLLTSASLNITTDLFPAYGRKNISIRIEYNGAFEKDVEKLIIRLEEPLSSIQGLSSIYSVSEPGKGTVYCSFSDSKNYDKAYMEVRDCVNRVYASFPETAHRPMLSKSGINNLPIFTASFPADNFPDSKQLEREFEGISGCCEAETGGIQGDEILIIPDSEKLIISPFTISEIVKRIRGENFSSVITAPGRIPVKTGKTYTGEDDINSLFLAPGIRLSDFSKNEERKKAEDSAGRINGEKTLILYAMKDGESSTIEVCRKLNKKAAALGGTIIFSRGEEIEKALTETALSAAAGIAAVIISAALYFRSTSFSILIILNILFSILTAAAALSLTGCRVDIISLSGLSVVSGLAIDNSVIVLENFKSSDSDISITLKETYSPLLYSFLTTAVVFLPVFFAAEKIKLLFRGMAVSVTAGLSASLIFTFYFTPLFLTGIKNKGSDFQRFTNIITKNGAEKLLKSLCIKKTLTILIILLLISISVFLIQKSDYQTFYYKNKNRLTFSMEYPAGIIFEHINNNAIKIEKQLLADKRLSAALKIEKERAVFDIKGDSEKTVKETENKIKELSDRYRTVYFHFPENDKILNSYDISIYGDDLEKTAETVYKLCEKIKSADDSLSVIFHFKKASEGIKIIINTSKAAAVSLTPQYIDRKIFTELSAPVISKYYSDGAEKDIRLGSLKMYSPENLKKLILKTGTGTAINLEETADFKTEVVNSRIYHKNRQRVLSFSVSGGGGNVKTIEKVLSEFEFENGYRGEGGNSYREKRSETGGFLFLAALAIFYIFTILVIQFESYRIPLIITTAVPASLAVPLAVMKILQIPLSASTALALLLISGISVNNSILVLARFRGRKISSLTETASSLSKKGGAVLMASFTTILSILPLLLSTGGGILTPFSVTLASGITGSILILPLTAALTCSRDMRTE